MVQQKKEWHTALYELNPTQPVAFIQFHSVCLNGYTWLSSSCAYNSEEFVTISNQLAYNLSSSLHYKDLGTDPTCYCELFSYVPVPTVTYSDKCTLPNCHWD